ncbi:diaminopropionate ammonia-lyase [Rhodococcus sp. NPDC003322]
MNVVVNAERAPGEVTPVDPDDIIRFHRDLDGYDTTPLLSLPAVAERLGVRTVWLKDESSRLGLPAFKILGASWAVFRALADLTELPGGPETRLDDLRIELETRRASHPDRTPTTLIAATDGNHGRAVARMAALLGLRSRILVPAGTVPARITAIAEEGAEVVVHQGNYDETVRAAAAQETATHIVVSDTAWEGYDRIPRWVIEGYSTIAAETLEQLDDAGEPEPTVVSLQVGVGAFASSMVRALVPRGVRAIAVEPTAAACLAPSLELGRRTVADGALDSIMAGLNCGEVSPLAWPELQAGVTACVTVDDDAAREAMRLLHAEGVTSGESGAAGLAGLLRAPELLSPDDIVLLVSTEGITDPDAYADIIAASATLTGA